MATSVETVIGTIPARSQRRSGRGFAQNKAGIFSAVVLAGLMILAVVGPFFMPYDPLVMDPTNSFAPPSAAHPFGTDEFGRDIMSRIIYGARISVGTAFLVVTIASLLGIPIGLIAGYFGGTIDAVLMRLIDAILAFPAILLAMTFIAVLGQGITNGVIAVTIVSIPAFARLIRVGTMQQKALEYVEAARCIGCTHARIMQRSILPNTLPAILPQIAINAGLAVLLEASLSFLGLGVKPPTPSWGQMLNAGRIYLYSSPWYGIFPGIFLSVLILSLNILADSLQRVLSRGRIP